MREEYRVGEGEFCDSLMMMLRAVSVKMRFT